MPRSMSVPTAPADDDDFDAFVGGGASTPATKPKSKGAAAKKSAAKKPSPRAQVSPPWEDAGDGRKQLPLFLPERAKVQLDYLRTKTGVPTQRLLSDLLIDAIDAKATEEWEG